MRQNEETVGINYELFQSECNKNMLYTSYSTVCLQSYPHYMVYIGLIFFFIILTVLLRASSDLSSFSIFLTP